MCYWALFLCYPTSCQLISLVLRKFYLLFPLICSVEFSLLSNIIPRILVLFLLLMFSLLSCRQKFSHWWQRVKYWHAVFEMLTNILFSSVERSRSERAFEIYSQIVDLFCYFLLKSRRQYHLVCCTVQFWDLF